MSHSPAGQKEDDKDVPSTSPPVDVPSTSPPVDGSVNGDYVVVGAGSNSDSESGSNRDKTAQNLAPNVEESEPDACDDFAGVRENMAGGAEDFQDDAADLPGNGNVVEDGRLLGTLVGSHTGVLRQTVGMCVYVSVCVQSRAYV